MRTIEYFDGLGRKVQTVHQSAAPGQIDLVDYTQYNNMGLPSRQWSLFNSDESGAYLNVPNAVIFSDNNPYGDNRPYISTTYENAPSPRIVEQHQAGNDWYNHNGTQIHYGLVGGVAHPVNVVKFELRNGGIAKNGQWEPGELFMERIIDEDGKNVISFYDKHNNLIFETNQFESQIGTYYIYNSIDLLCYVIPPKLSEILVSQNNGTFIPDTDQNMEELAYIYKYDIRSRLCSKKMPAAETVILYYDKIDNLIALQDGNQRTNQVCIVNAYDNQGRQAYTSLLQLNQNQFTTM